MRISQNGIELIEEFEGLRLKAYDDGVGVWTIGIGTTRGFDNKPIKPGMTISHAQAIDLFKRDLAKFELAVMRLVKVPMNQNQFDALLSLTYNIGEGNFGRSTLLKRLNARDYAGAANQFEVWNRAGGRVLTGLTRRRAAERRLFSLPANAIAVAVPEELSVSAKRSLLLVKVPTVAKLLPEQSANLPLDKQIQLASGTWLEIETLKPDYASHSKVKLLGTHKTIDDQSLEDPIAYVYNGHCQVATC